MRTYDYYCTWQAQNFLCQTKNVSNRDYLDENALFNDVNGLVNNYKGLRKDLIFVLDDGWDVPYSYNVKESYPFASHIIRDDRFPSFNKSPKEKLKQMVDKIKTYGWKGVGIWVCAQGYENDYTKSIEELKEFFKERLLWSKYANIMYWKVDWGIYCNDVKYRRMLVRLTKKYYPELIVENAMCINPVNGFNNGEEEQYKYMFPWNKEMFNYIDKVTKFSEVFRSYDVTEELSTNSTLARLTYLLKKSNAIINAEDELYLAAVLNCSYGIERTPYSTVTATPKNINFNFKCNEVKAAINYRHISPVFKRTPLRTSKEQFLDEYSFGGYWCDNVTNATVKQLCPARVSRNTSLPKVKAIKEVPYVVCCKDLNNNYAIGTFKRINYENDDKYLVDVSVKINQVVKNIAIFSNQIKTLKVKFAENVNFSKIVLVNLMNKSRRDVTNKIIIKNNQLIINYEELTKRFKCDDNSCKAYMLRLYK